jgi:hypothetical protein
MTVCVLLNFRKSITQWTTCGNPTHRILRIHECRRRSPRKTSHCTKKAVPGPDAFISASNSFPSFSVNNRAYICKSCIHVHHNIQSISHLYISYLFVSNLFISTLVISYGKELEAEMNASGPGTAFFVQCDVSKESNIKVSLWLELGCIISWYYRFYFDCWKLVT